MRKRRGVTLLELMTVVIVVGILAALAIPLGFRAQERVRGGKAMEALGTIRASQLRFREWSRSMRNQDVYTMTPGDLDFELGVDDDWTYTVADATAPTLTSRATATRTAAHGGTTSNIIQITFVSSALCSNASVYGLTICAGP